MENEDEEIQKIIFGIKNQKSLFNIEMKTKHKNLNEETFQKLSRLIIDNVKFQSINLDGVVYGCCVAENRLMAVVNLKNLDEYTYEYMWLDQYINQLFEHYNIDKRVNWPFGELDLEKLDNLPLDAKLIHV